jgi:hypothetical protein
MDTNTIRPNMQHSLAVPNMSQSRVQRRRNLKSSPINRYRGFDIRITPHIWDCDIELKERILVLCEGLVNDRAVDWSLEIWRRMELHEADCSLWCDLGILVNNIVRHVLGLVVAYVPILWGFKELNVVVCVTSLRSWLDHEGHAAGS